MEENSFKTKRGNGIQRPTDSGNKLRNCKFYIMNFIYIYEIFIMDSIHISRIQFANA